MVFLVLGKLESEVSGGRRVRSSTTVPPLQGEDGTIWRPL